MRGLLRRTLISIAAAGTLIGCVFPIGTPHDTGYRQSVPEQMPDFIHEGVTTRDDVLLGLGRPHARRAGDGWFVYGSSDIQGGVWFFVPWLAELKVMSIRYRRLVVRFDDLGVVTRAEIVERTCPRVTGDVPRFDQPTVDE